MLSPVTRAVGKIPIVRQFNEAMGIGFGKNEAYRMDRLTPVQKDNLIDAVLTLFLLGASWAGYIAMFGADSGADEDPLAKQYWRVMMNFTQQYNPIEVFRDVQNANAPSLKVMYRQMAAIAYMT